MNPAPPTWSMPPRWTSESLRNGLAVITLSVVVLICLAASGFTIDSLIRGLPRMSRLAGQMIPPDFSRFPAIVRSLGVTTQIALAGTGLGIVLSIPLGVLASRSHSLTIGMSFVVQSGLALLRTIPELVWAIVFVACLGPGAMAGILAIMVDTVGFAGRFFAGAIDDCDRGPQEALTSLGARRWQILLGAVLPAALPALIHTAIYALERAIRASVVLGIVGAGGIGIELKVSMELFEFRRASAIMLSILVVVLIVELVGSTVRRRLLSTT